MSKRRKYSTEFKQGAVEQARHPGVSCAQIARELGVGANVLTRWKRGLREPVRSAAPAVPKMRKLGSSSSSCLA